MSKGRIYNVSATDAPVVVTSVKGRIYRVLATDAPSVIVKGRIYNVSATGSNVVAVTPKGRIYNVSVLASAGGTTPLLPIVSVPKTTIEAMEILTIAVSHPSGSSGITFVGTIATNATGGDPDLSFDPDTKTFTVTGPNQLVDGTFKISIYASDGNNLLSASVDTVINTIRADRFVVINGTKMPSYKKVYIA